MPVNISDFPARPTTIATRSSTRDPRPTPSSPSAPSATTRQRVPCRSASSPAARNRSPAEDRGPDAVRVHCIRFPPLSIRKHLTRKFFCDRKPALLLSLLYRVNYKIIIKIVYMHMNIIIAKKVATVALFLVFTLAFLPAITLADDGSFCGGWDDGSFGGGWDDGSFGGGWDDGSFGGGWDDGSFGGGWDDAYDCDYGCYTDEYGVDYFYDESFSGGGNYGQSTPRTTPGCTSCGGSRSTPPITVRNPSYPTPSYPSYPPQRPQPQPQPYVYNYPSSNTNVNTITNTNPNVNNVDNSNNSINNSFNSSVARVTPVSSDPVQDLV